MPAAPVRYAAYALLALVVVAAYANSFSSQFVFDNNAILLDDPRLHAVTWAHMRDIFTRGYWWPSADLPLYRPLTTLSYLVNYAVLGNTDRPAGYHAVNLLLHAANIALAFGIAHRLSKRFWVAFSIAAIWAAHPLLTEAVTNIVGRADLLAALGVLGALYCYIRSHDAPARYRLRWQIGVLVAAVVAVCSKESGAILPAILILYDVLVGEGFGAWKTRWRFWLVTAVPLVLFLLARAIVVDTNAPHTFSSADNPIVGAGFLQGRLTAFAVLGRYLALFFWPSVLSPDYSFAQIPLATGSAVDIVAWLAVASLAVLAAVLATRARGIAFALAFAFLALLPSSNLLFASGTIMAERLMYLPALGLTAAVVTALALVADDKRRLPVLLGVTGVVVLAGTVRTFERNREWRDELSLWTAAVAAAPGSFKTHSAYAEALYQSDPSRANLDRVIAEQEQSLAILAALPDPAESIKPMHEAAVYNLERGDWLRAHNGSEDEVLAAYTQAAEHERRYLSLLDRARTYPNAPSAKDESDAYLLLATATSHLADPVAAATAARASRDRQPFESLAYRTEASALISAGRPDEAALTLMTGFMVSGDNALRTALLGLYAAGLDPDRCAAKENDRGVTILNDACAIVHRHLCAASAAVAAIYDHTGKTALAAATRTSAVTQFACGQ
ncbi:MAG: DUF1736 domain-containing protein [Acidobacteriaceae bacterium]|nr:DUF1736 domain-containing protein [Acidobacteriaceae bacterium]